MALSATIALSLTIVCLILSATETQNSKIKQYHETANTKKSKKERFNKKEHTQKKTD